MEGAKEFITLLRSKYSILITPNLEEYLETLYQTCANLEEIDIQEYTQFCFDKKEIEIITNELQKVIKSAKLQQKKKQLIKIIEERDQEEKFKRKSSFGSDNSETDVLENTQTSLIKEKENQQQNEQEGKIKEEIDDSNEKIKQPRPSKQQKREEVKPDAKLDAKSETKPKGLKQQLEEQKKEKCRKYPFCGKINCEYFHPNEKCIYFPKCNKGQNCLYMHDICKYGSLCCRVDCFYDHNPKIKGIQPFNLLIKVKSTYSTELLFKEGKNKL